MSDPLVESSAQSSPSRLRIAAFTPIGDEGRSVLVEGQLVRAISTGTFAQGERLPSENELAQLLGVSVVTVREALIALRHRGYIETRRGRNGGSFVRPSPEAMKAVNTRALLQMSRLALADLGLHYEATSSNCAEYACLRASAEELEVVRRLLAEVRDKPSDVWRQRVTNVQLELAALSQSVRLTNEHIRLQTEFTPLLTLQDFDMKARNSTHDELVAQINGTIAGDFNGVKQAVRRSVRFSVRWLMAYREEKLSARHEISIDYEALDSSGSQLREPLGQNGDGYRAD